MGITATFDGFVDAVIGAINGETHIERGTDIGKRQTAV